MKTAPPGPHETTWEQWLLGGGALTPFEDPQLPLEVEIGPGEDDFLFESAIAHPETNWLGIEYSQKRIRRYDRKVQRQAGLLGNLRLIWRPAADLVGPFLSPAVVSAYHIYFPDPWPKAHHARYRLLAPSFVEVLCESLMPGGRIDLATDSAEYAEQIREAFDTALRMHAEEPGNALEGDVPGARATVFEERWRAEGRNIHFLRYRKDA